MDKREINIDNKYRFIEEDGFKLKCLRYEEEWRDFVGDKAIHRLFDYAIDNSTLVADLVAGLEELNNATEDIKDRGADYTGSGKWQSIELATARKQASALIVRAKL